MIDVSCKRVCRASRKANDVIAKMGAQSFMAMVSEPIRLRTDYIYVSIASSGVCDGEVTHLTRSSGSTLLSSCRITANPEVISIKCGSVRIGDHPFGTPKPSLGWRDQYIAALAPGDL